MKTLHFPKSSGLSPRPFDAYDAACEKLFRAVYNRNSPTAIRARREAEKELIERFGSDDLDTDFTHGRNIVKFYTIVEE